MLKIIKVVIDGAKIPPMYFSQFGVFEEAISSFGKSRKIINILNDGAGFY